MNKGHYFHVLITMLLVICSGALAADEVVPKIHIQQVDKNFPVQQMKASGVEIHTLEKTSSDEWDLPPVLVRDRIFRESDLATDVSSWDHLDRDMLFLRARSFDAKELRNIYPQINAKKLSKLKQLIQRDIKKQETERKDD